MYRSRVKSVARAVLALALATALVDVPSAAAQDPTNPRSLVFQVVDLVFTVESLDGAERTTETDRDVKVVLGADVLFAFDRADLTGRADTTLREVVEQIRAKAKGTVRIDGYTDAKGAPAYNMDLSRRRAVAVEQALTKLLGVGFQFVASGHGANNPVAPNTKPGGSDDPKGRAKNRRVTITFGKQ
jgi:outer membrane protein OmpA-like peptidoglycan-associated protein